MNKLKLQAMGIVLGILALSAGVVFVLHYLPVYVPMALCFLFLCYVMYHLVLTRLEFDAKISKLNDEYKQ